MESQLRIKIGGGTYQEDRQTRIKEEHLVGSVDVRGDVLLLPLRWQQGEKQLVAKRDAAVLWEMAVLFTRGKGRQRGCALVNGAEGEGSPNASAELAWEVGDEGCYMCKGKQAWGCRWEKAGCWSCAVRLECSWLRGLLKVESRLRREIDEERGLCSQEGEACREDRVKS